MTQERTELRVKLEVQFELRRRRTLTVMRMGLDAESVRLKGDMFYYLSLLSSCLVWWFIEAYEYHA